MYVAGDLEYPADWESEKDQNNENAEIDEFYDEIYGAILDESDEVGIFCIVFL